MKSYLRAAMFNRFLSLSCLLVLLLFGISTAKAGSIFLTGHDPDFHALSSFSDPTGPRKINTTAIGYILDPGFNAFASEGVNKFLFVESSIPTPAGHRIGKNGIIASGYVEGVDFDHATASDLTAALDLLGTTYAGIVVASDYGGLLTQEELDILNTRSTDIINFLNAGGGLYAMAEGNGGAHLTPGGGHFGFLPFVTSTPFDSVETDVTVTSFGSSLGLTDSDVNAHVSHNIFLGTYGLNVVDQFPDSSILSLAGRGILGDSGVVPVPPAVWLFGSGLLGLVGIARRKKVA